MTDPSIDTRQLPISGSVTEVIAAKLAARLLRAGTPATTFKGLGSGHPCAACEREISTTDIETECVFRDGQSLRLHIDCFMEWQRLQLS